MPTFLTLLLLAVQPVCLLYTRAVMESAAAETARLMITGEDEDGASYEAFALRRLAAVPDLSIFHEGGALAWDIELGLARDNDGQVIVAIEGTVSPLPVLGAFVAAFGDTDEQGDVVLHVEVSYEARPSWLEGDYDSWIGEWD